MLRDFDRIQNSESLALRGWLVDGDEGHLAGLRSRRRKSFVASLTLQIIFVAGLIFLPLFAAGKRPLLATFTVTPRFYGARRSAADSNRPHSRSGYSTSPRPIFAVSSPRPGTPRETVVPDDRSSLTCNLCKTGDSGMEDIGAGWPDGIHGWPIPEGQTLPMAPLAIAPKPPALVHRSSMDPAMLIHRVEPEYPVLARMARREGQVQLRAVIAIDGSIESLRVVGGDPLFMEAAKAAVLQWRYRPTTLNGQAVEVDTFVTVIFTLSR